MRITRSLRNRPGVGTRAGGRAAIVFASVVALILPPGTAGARHGASYLDGDEMTQCKAYATEASFHTTPEAGLEAAVLVAEFAHDVTDKVADQPIAKAISASILAAAKTALLVVSGINRVAQACVEGRHWELEDDLMLATIQANLTVTTTPDLGFVMPEVSRGSHISVRNDTRAGFLNRERSGEDELPEGMKGSAPVELGLVSVKMTVARTITGMIDAKQCTCTTAKNTYNAAVDELAKESPNYKYAYKLFRQAYVYAFSN